MVDKEGVVLVFVYDDGIDLLIGKRWPAGHAYFANRGTDADHADGAFWQHKPVLVVAAFWRKKPGWFDVTSETIDVRGREERVKVSKEFRLRTRRRFARHNAA